MSLLPKALSFPNDIPLVLKRVERPKPGLVLTPEQEFERYDWPTPTEVKKLVTQVLKSDIPSDLDPLKCDLMVGDEALVVDPDPISFNKIVKVIRPWTCGQCILVEVPEGKSTREARFTRRHSLRLVRRDGVYLANR